MSLLHCVIFALAAAASLARTLYDDHSDRCEPITIQMCVGIGYNYTSMPNQFNHFSQNEAGLEVAQFVPLVTIKCSPFIRFFLCSLYAPICIKDYNRPLPPCRGVCERARNGCGPLMLQYGFQWPSKMDCDQFPEHGSDRLCMDDPNLYYKGDSAPPTKPPTAGLSDPFNAPPIDPQLPPISNFPVEHNRPKKPTNKITPPSKPGIGSGRSHSFPTKTADQCTCKCNSAYFVPMNATSPLYNVSTGGSMHCGQACHSKHFSGEREQTFNNIWIGIWSGLCFLTTLVTILTFLIEPSRFSYPERPIIYLSLCYNLVSVGYMVRLAFGHEAVACDGDLARYSTSASAHTASPTLCVIVFLLIYFFGMASALWWVTLSFCWFLSAGLKWGSECIAKFSQYFHLAAWVIPAVKTVVVLLSGAVDGDPVTGICYVGNMNLANLRGFVIGPLVAYLIVGTSFLFLGFISLFRIRTAIKSQMVENAPQQPPAPGGLARIQAGRQLEKLMLRIGIFSILYTVPATTVIACLFYEQYLRDTWERSVNCPSCFGPGSDSNQPLLSPDFSVFMTRHLMCLLMGIVCGVWIWSGKTVDSWRAFFRACCRRKRTVRAAYSSHRTRHSRVYEQFKRSSPDGALSVYDENVNGSLKPLTHSHV